jgi:hypothetical protein
VFSRYGICVEVKNACLHAYARFRGLFYSYFVFFDDKAR